MTRLATASRGFIVSAVAAAGLAACEIGMEPRITKSENAALSGDVAAYHLCVAHTAATIDDGQSPMPDVTGAAMDRCLPVALEISKILDGAKLPDDFKSHYLGELLASALRQSAIMLRRRRAPDWDAGSI